MQYNAGHSFFLQTADEVTDIVENGSSDPTLPAVPASGSRTLVGQINPADIVKDDGDEKGYGAGNPFSIYDQEKGRTYDMSVNLRVQSFDSTSFIRRCLYNGEGTLRYHLPRLAMFYGTSASGRVMRQAVCNSLSCQFSEGSGSEFQATAALMAMYEESATLDVPTLDNFQALGAPATWHDMTDFTIDGTSYRQELAGISFSQTHNIERKGFRPNLFGGVAAASRTVYELLPHHVNGEGELTFHAEVKTATNDWGEIIMTIGGNSVTLVNCHPAQRHQPGVESSAQLGWSVPFKFDYIDIG